MWTLQLFRQREIGEPITDGLRMHLDHHELPAEAIGIPAQARQSRDAGLVSALVLRTIIATLSGVFQCFHSLVTDDKPSARAGTIYERIERCGDQCCYRRVNGLTHVVEMPLHADSVAMPARWEWPMATLLGAGTLVGSCLR